MGFLLFGGGLYWVFNSFTVSSSWGHGYWGIGSLRMPMGTMLIPLLVGIGLLFFFEKKAIGGFVCALGVLIILISLITSLSFHATSGTLYTYILMFGMVAAAGIRIVASQPIGRKESLVLAIAFGFGLGVELCPDILKHAPDAIKNIFSSGLVAGGVAAIAANALIRIKE